MFTVIDIETNELVKVFAVRNDSNGYPNFLIFDGGWKYKSAKQYFPVYDFSSKDMITAELAKKIKEGTY